MTSDWSTTSEVRDLASDTIHVWLLKLDENLVEVVQHPMTKPELERAAAFRFPTHRNEFVITRGALRFLLGEYLNISPQSVEIRSAERGKPCVAGERGSNIQFNVSHSGEYAVLCFTTDEELGIDIERHNADAIDNGMLDQCFMTSEKEGFARTSIDRRVQFFFDTWSRKEAYMKLIGDGMNIPPNEFSLSGSDSNRDVIRGDEIYFTALPAPSGYSAALATRHGEAKIEFYKLGSNLLR